MQKERRAETLREERKKKRREIRKKRRDANVVDAINKTEEK